MLSYLKINKKFYFPYDLLCCLSILVIAVVKGSRAAKSKVEPPVNLIKLTLEVGI